MVENQDGRDNNGCHLIETRMEMVNGTFITAIIKCDQLTLTEVMITRKAVVPGWKNIITM